MPGYTFVPASRTVTVSRADVPALDFSAAVAINATWSVLPDPAGTSYNLRAVTGTSASDVWLAAGAGFDLHWDGSALSAPANSSPSLMYAAWASSPSDVWLAGNGYYNHFNGTTWASAYVGLIYSIWGTGPSDVWLLGSDGGSGAWAQHWNGAAWTKYGAGATPLPVGASASSYLMGAWGSASNDLWVGGYDGSIGAGVILHWNGFTWTNVKSVPTNAVHALWGASPTDVWAAGDGSTMLRWDGTSWVSGPFPGNSVTVNGIWGSSATDIWFVGGDYAAHAYMLHWDGTAMASVNLPVAPGNNLLFGAWGSAANDVWVVGQSGLILRYR
jgi:hypothetical protein